MFCIAKKSNVGSGIKLNNPDYVTSVCTDRETLNRDRGYEQLWAE